VWLVELAPVAVPIRVARAVAGVLGVHEPPSVPISQLVADALQGQRVLLPAYQMALYPWVFGRYLNVRPPVDFARAISSTLRHIDVDPSVTAVRRTFAMVPTPR
jgi:hypothetical protein